MLFSLFLLFILTSPHGLAFMPSQFGTVAPKLGDGRRNTGYSFSSLLCGGSNRYETSSSDEDEEVSSSEKTYPDVKKVVFHKSDQIKALESRVIAPGFKLRMEFEYTSEGNTWDIHNEFAFVYVYLPDGRQYSLNVWTFEFFQTAIKQELENGLNGEYLTPPDLFVKEMTRDCIERVISDLLSQSDGYLEGFLNPTVIDTYCNWSKRRRIWKRFDHTLRWGLRRLRKKLGLIDEEWDEDYYTLQNPIKPTNNVRSDSTTNY